MGPEFYENPTLPIDEIKELTLKINDDQAIDKLMTALMAEGDYKSELAESDISTLVLQGEYDFLCLPTMAKELADSIPQSHFKIIENVGHTLNIEAIPQVAEKFKDFFQ